MCIVISEMLSDVKNKKRTKVLSDKVLRYILGYTVGYTERGVFPIIFI